MSASLRSLPAATSAARSSGAAFPISFDAALCGGAEVFDATLQLPVRGFGREHVVDEAGGDPLALDAAAVLGLVAEALEIDHSPSSARTCARSPSSHELASRHALVAARRRT